ncbi:MAG: hypothetical protein J5755_01080, partial [Clostridia bacterium]|nr:hypothetical protein [Clostridia bacterium]
MKRAFVLYAIVWAILLAAFNVICLATPNEIFGLPKADTAFWVSFALINVSFVGQLFCAFLAFKGDSLRKLFYRLSLITISYVDLSIMTVLGVIILVIPFIPNWVGAIVSGALLVFGAISVIAAKGASEAVERIDDKVAARTSFVTNLIITAEGLRARAK